MITWVLPTFYFTGTKGVFDSRVESSHIILTCGIYYVYTSPLNSSWKYTIDLFRFEKILKERKKETCALPIKNFVVVAAML